ASRLVGGLFPLSLPCVARTFLDGLRGRDRLACSVGFILSRFARVFRTWSQRVSPRPRAPPLGSLRCRNVAPKAVHTARTAPPSSSVRPTRAGRSRDGPRRAGHTPDARGATRGGRRRARYRARSRTR